MRFKLWAVSLMLSFAAVAYADTINGTVTNATDGKPASGVSITLVDPMGGMAEIGSAKADAQGHFKIEAAAAQGPRLVRAEKGGVNYFKMLTPGSTNVDLEVYEASASVEGISGSADVVRLQTQGSTLQGIELFAVKNDSKPMRTLASNTTFEFALPEGAQIDGADAQGPNGQPIAAIPKPTKEKNHYAFSYPLKPGETRFQVSYHLPYSGNASFAPKLSRPFEHYVLVLPSTMSFTAKDASAYRSMTNQPGTTVQVSVRSSGGQDLGYSVSGSGSIPDEQAQGPQGGDSGAMGGGGESRPGGGLGRPIDAPDGLARYRWYILGALVTVLVGGGIWTHERTKQDTVSEAAFRPSPQAVQPPSLKYAAAQASPSSLQQQPYTAPASAPGGLLLAALKEELFQLEIERQQGKISPEDYAKAHAALEQTLQRALARASQG